MKCFVKTVCVLMLTLFVGVGLVGCFGESDQISFGESYFGRLGHIESFRVEYYEYDYPKKVIEIKIGNEVRQKNMNTGKTITATNKSKKGFSSMFWEHSLYNLDSLNSSPNYEYMEDLVFAGREAVKYIFNASDLELILDKEFGVILQESYFNKVLERIIVTIEVVSFTVGIQSFDF